MKAVPSPHTQQASKPFENKKPAIKIKIAGGTTNENPKVSVITSLQVNKKLTQPTRESNSSSAEVMPLEALTLDGHKVSDVNSKLNNPGPGFSSISSSLPSPGQRFTSALNTAHLLVPGARIEQTSSQIARSSSENESSSGESSSDESSRGLTARRSKHGKVVELGTILGKPHHPVRKSAFENNTRFIYFAKHFVLILGDLQMENNVNYLSMASEYSGQPSGTNIS